MEAVPKLSLLSFELKVSSENTHFGPKLKQYIKEAYREDPDSYGNEIHQLEGLRSAAVRSTLDSSGLNALYKYYCQLRAIQSRFPMAKGQPVAIPFAWKDLYANMSCSLADIRFEMACVLYNIGAMHTQLGAAEPRTTPDSLKSVCTHYQHAAWAFHHLRDQFPQPSGADLSTDILKFLQEVCFAQAQECILDKSIQDSRKSSVIGAVATQVLLYYRNSLALLGPSTGQDNIHEVIGTKLYNKWHRFLSFKASYIGCIVALYQGMQAEEQQKMGERVAYYNLAAEKLTEARKLEKYILPAELTLEAMTFTNDVVEGKRKAAKNENEFIYHEEVPDKSLLSDFKPVCLVRTLPINFNDPEISGPDIFSRLVPMGAHEASSMYSEEKAKLLRRIVSLAETKNGELAEFMSSLQLDQLDVIVNPEQKIPQEIVDRCAAMNAQSEVIQKLVDSMNSLAEIISDVEHNLAEIKSLIQEEAAKEKEYQRVMGPRPPSIVHTELSREFNKYQEAHTRTNESNQVLHKAMTLHIANLRLLALPLDQLEYKIPSIDNIEGLDRETMLEMRRVVTKAREMQQQRDTLIQELREDVNADDITSQLLARNSEPLSEIFKQEVEKHTPKVKIIEQNLAAQENIMNRLTTLYASYGESRRLLADVSRKRDGLINALVTSYDTYEELLAKSQKGLDFYRKLSSNVSQLLTRMKSTCQVQEEERAQLLAKQNSKTVTMQHSTAQLTVKSSDIPTSAVTSVESAAPKLKDYLPYMKNRGHVRTPTPAPLECLSTDSYYQDSMCPTSARPAPVGSEATTDTSQYKYPDGYVVSSTYNPNQYNPYISQYGQKDPNPYTVTSDYPSYPVASNFSYGQQNFKPTMNTDSTANVYNTSYVPAQYSTQMTNPQNYNPYYTQTRDNGTAVSDSENIHYESSNISQVNINPCNPYNTYTDACGMSMPTNVTGHFSTASETTPSVSYTGQMELNTGFNQMQITSQKDVKPLENAGGSFITEYSQTYYSMQYPQTSTPHVATYSNAELNANTYMSPSQLPTDYSSLNYPYSNIESSAAPANQAYDIQTVNPNISAAYSYSSVSYDDTIQSAYPTYTVADSTSYITSSAASNTSIPNVEQPYTIPYADSNITADTLSQLDAVDKPIKSHVTGEALSIDPRSFQPIYQSYSESQNIVSNGTNYTNLSDPNIHTSNYVYQDSAGNINLSQTYQNHPGYAYSLNSGSYEYNYGSQNSFSSYGTVSQSGVDSQNMNKDENWTTQSTYTNAGICQTVQSPSENMQTLPEAPNSTNQNYYNSPYGYQTNQNDGIVQNVQKIENIESVSISVSVSNSQLSNTQSTYMQSRQLQNTTVTYTNDQDTSPVTTAKETVTETNTTNTQVVSAVTNETVDTTTASAPKAEPLPSETKAEPTAFDLLSDIDFTVNQAPLMPEIKVPPASESTIKRPIVSEPILKSIPKPQEVVIERPAKRDLFSDPILLNEFTQEIKKLQNHVDSLTNKMPNGLTLLDTKWKTFQDLQTKENMNRTKTIAMQHSDGNIVTDVVPYDDSRLTLKSNPDAYINASYYKQLASWCVPLVISSLPNENEYSIFWKAVIENKISCIVCLLSEIEMQGKSYWPTVKNQPLELEGIRVTLTDLTCNIHWTERKLNVQSGNIILNVVQYQISVFPAKIVCSPLVMLADKVSAATYDNRLSNQLGAVWVHCARGAGRSSVLASLLAIVCQVRAGQVALCDMLDTIFTNLHKHRSNVLEETKYLADAYRTILFYVQGVLCS
ncbi:Tyrosine-protein phosphatase non-receptor type 23, partial [Eumeta japonica]